MRTRCGCIRVELQHLATVDPSCGACRCVWGTAPFLISSLSAVHCNCVTRNNYKWILSSCERHVEISDLGGFVTE